jgi:hypothetical protein
MTGGQRSASQRGSGGATLGNPINWPRYSRPTIGDWLLWAFIAYAVIGSFFGIVYGLFFSDPVCCAGFSDYPDSLR